MGVNRADALSAKAAEALDGGDFETAIELFFSARDASLGCGDAKAASVHWVNAVRTASKAGHLDATEWAREALKFAEEHAEPIGLVFHRIVLAQADTADNARLLIAQATTSEALDALIGEARVTACLEAADRLLQLGARTEAARVLKLSLPEGVRVRISPGQAEGFFYSLLGSSERLAMLGCLEEADKLAAFGLDVNMGPELSTVRGKALCTLSGISLRRRDLGRARELAEKSAELAEEMGSPEVKAAAHLASSAVDDRIGDYEQALAHLEVAAPIFSQLNDRLGLARVLGQQGLVLRQLNRLDEARSAFSMARDEFVEAGDHQGLARNYANSALLYVILGDHEKALSELRAALRFYALAKDLQGKIETLVDIASAYLRRSRLRCASRICGMCRSLWPVGSDAVSWRIEFVSERIAMERSGGDPLDDDEYDETQKRLERLAEGQSVIHSFAVNRERAKLAIRQRRWGEAEVLLLDLAREMEPWAEGFLEVGNRFASTEHVATLWDLLAQVYCVGRRDPAAVVNCLEHQKCRILLGQLGHIAAELLVVVPPEMAERERSLVQDMSTCLSSADGSERLRLPELSRDLQAVYDRMRASSSELAEYADFKQGRPAAIEEIHELLLGSASSPQWEWRRMPQSDVPSPDERTRLR